MGDGPYNQRQRIENALRDQIDNPKKRKQLSYVLWIGCTALAGNRAVALLDQRKLNSEVLKVAASLLQLKGWTTGSGHTGCTKLLECDSKNAHIDTILKKLRSGGISGVGVPPDLDGPGPRIWTPGGD